MTTYATYETEVGLSRLRQKQLRAAKQPGESDISIARADRNIEGVAHLNSDKPLVQTKSKRLDLRAEWLDLEVIGEKTEASVKISM
ncbi:hypothetical protein RSAG8_03603, partial [Rhizoctonia solani AG-8 WAC10335]